MSIVITITVHYTTLYLPSGQDRNLLSVVNNRLSGGLTLGSVAQLIVVVMVVVVIVVVISIILHTLHYNTLQLHLPRPNQV